MNVIELLMEVTNSFLLALALLIGLIVEGVKQSQRVSAELLPLVASGVGVLVGLLIGLIYQQSLVLMGLNGLIAGLLAAGSFDWFKALWQLPGPFK